MRTWTPSYQPELYHFGVKGMKWGVRRYRNEYGHLTQAGYRRKRKLEAKGDKAYAKGNIKKAGKLYAKAGAVSGSDVAKTQELTRWKAARSRFDEMRNRTEEERAFADYLYEPDLPNKKSQKIRKDALDEMHKNKEIADIYKADADLYEKRSKALIAKYGDLVPESYSKSKIKWEENAARKQMEYLNTKPFESKRLKKKLKEAEAYENLPQNKADKESMKGKYDDEGRPLLSDWPKLTESDRIKDDIKRLKRGYAN